MSRIRMAVKITNASGHPLRLVESNLEVGDWTDPWYPPPTIASGTAGEFRAEGGLVAVPTTGTEGRARYVLDGVAARRCATGRTAWSG